MGPKLMRKKVTTYKLNQCKEKEKKNFSKHLTFIKHFSINILYNVRHALI